MYISIRNALMHDLNLPMGFYENLRFGTSSPRRRRRMIRVFYLFLLSFTLSPRVTMYFGRKFNVQLLDPTFLTSTSPETCFGMGSLVTSQASLSGCILIDVSSKGVQLWDQWDDLI